MQVPSILQGESLKRLLQGAAAGAVATIVVGFSWGGWSLSSTADTMAKARSELAVVAALAPVCADKFRALPDAEAKKVALSKVDSWKRRDEFPKEFVTLPGASYPNSALVDACYTLLLASKSAALN
jgi:alpha/beta superfamily hydrolase